MLGRHWITLSSVEATATTISSSTSLSALLWTFWNSALKAYKKQTNNDIHFHPLAAQLQACQSPSAILAVLQQGVQART